MCSRTDEISVVRRGANAHSFGGPSKQITHIVRQVLEGIRSGLELWRQLQIAENLIVNDVVVSWSGSALNRGVRLEEEVPVASLGDAAVNHRTIHRVTPAVCIFVPRRVEASVASLPDDDDRNAWLASFSVWSRIHRFAGLTESRKFLLEDNVVLALRHTIPVHRMFSGKFMFLSLQSTRCDLKSASRSATISWRAG